MTKLCTVISCNEQIKDTEAFCKKHWFALSKAMRDKIWKSFKAKSFNRETHIKLLREAAKTIEDK